MPIKPPSKPTARAATGQSSTDKRKSKSPSSWSNVKKWTTDERFSFILGLLLFVIVLYFSLAFISFMFTGGADQSILELPDKAEQRLQIQNWTGLLGALGARLFLDQWFGVPSFMIAFALTVLAFRLMKVRWLSLSKTLFHTAFWLIWGSTTIAYLFQGLYAHSFFHWGGLHGHFIANWLNSYIQLLGTGLLLFSTFLVYAIFSYSGTIPFLKRVGSAFKNLFKKKEKSTEKNLYEEGSELEPVAVGTEIIPEEWVERPQEGEDNEVVFDIKAPAREAHVEEFTVNQPTSNDLVESADADTRNELDIEIERPMDTELGSQVAMEKYNPTLDLSHYKFPSLDLLKTYPNENAPIIDMAEQNANKNKIVTTLRNYGIEIESIKATVGPTITLYEIVPKAGIRISKIRNLESDIMLSLAATGIRIIAPIPGKGTIGIEVPNEHPQIVSMHSTIASKKFQEECKYALPVALGRTITNEVFMFDLAKTPHLLVAGATGQGKSVGLNAIITSLLYKKHPAELKFVLVDPKMVEFNIYAALEKHYMAKMPDEESVIITDSTKVIHTLNSLVIEMEDRYKLLMAAHCRNIIEYNEKFINRQLNPEKGHRYLPYIVIVVDEFGDLIMVAGKEVEMPISRITQKARAVGMHMILATQRPSVNIITGVIKANIPGRVAFRVSSMIDSRTILDAPGANQLVGRGDLLYSQGSDLVRVQCAFVDTPEVEEIVKHVSQQQAYPSAYDLPEYVPGDGDGAPAPGSVDLSKRDSMFTEVARFVVAQQQGSTSVIQRKFQIGYNRAGRISDQLEVAGIVSANNGSKGRQVLIQDDITLTQILESLQ